MGGHQHWQGVVPRLRKFADNRWVVQCGDTRYDGTPETAAVARGSDAAINFQVSGQGEDVTSFSFSVAWLRHPGWQLMFHFDPEEARWPHHASHHIQFEARQEDARLPPFLSWRIPFGETEPERVHEFIVSQIMQE